ncbi:MAG: hypothetical protein LUD50_04690 [Clostridia bacterium]|nr:hypothetical protein [Clostridia bacterium]
MQYVSTEYKAAMKQTARNKSYMRISLGLINQEAQATAQVEEADFTYFSDTYTPLTTESVEKVYATLEQDFSRVDGSMYFLPREGSSRTLYTNGIVTEQLLGLADEASVMITFNTGDPLDIKGLTLTFGAAYPTLFRIDTDEVSQEYENSSAEFTTEDTFNNTTWMKITALQMVNGISRLRIYNIVFGIGIMIDDDKIVDSSLKSTLSPISEDLPTIDFSVTIENMDHYYNVDNEASAINYMETGQQAVGYYGYTLNDSSVEWVKGFTLWMQEWKADDTTATFGAVDVFTYMQDDYKRGVYHAEGISLYDLAIDVLTDAGKGEDEYWIDPYLKNVIVTNPLPVATHKECLQLIANAGRSILMQSRDGVIMIKSSFEPEISVSANQVAEYGSIEALLEDEATVEYAAYEQDFSRVNGAMYFMPRSANYLDVGYVSESISGADGTFEEDPVITLTMESAYTFYSLTLLFGSALPVSFVITTYNNGEQRDRFLSKAISAKTIVSYDFIDCDMITIDFTEAAPYNRIHLERVVFGEETDYELTYHELYSSPYGTKLEKVKEMRVTRTIYTNGTELKDLSTDDAVISPDSTEFEVEFSDPVHGLSVRLEEDDEEVDYGAEIAESGSYWCRVVINSPPSTEHTVNLTIQGYEYGVSTVTTAEKLHNAGTIETWENPLISTDEEAQDLLEWVGAYYKVENEYDLTYRGDPILDCNDLVYLESEYAPDLMIRLEEVGLSYNGALSGTLKARRRAEE